MMAGNLAAMRPALMCWMVKPDPQAITRATASPGPATGSGTSVNSNGVFGPFRTIAFIGIVLCQKPGSFLRNLSPFHPLVQRLGRARHWRPDQAFLVQLK